MRLKAGMIAAVTLLALLAGCAPSQREMMVERDLAEMKRRLAGMEQGLASDRQALEATVQERFDALGRRLADQQAAQDALRVELQATRGRLDDLQTQTREARESGGLLQEDLGLRLNKLETAMEELAKKAATPAPAPPAAAAPPPQSLYERGRELVQKQEYAAGRVALEEFLKGQPQNELAPNARYWIGEAYYGEKKYQDAILEFQEVIDRYGEHPKAASALFKQGLAFAALGEKKNARVVLRKLVESYPRAEETKRAKERLAEWDKQEKKDRNK